MSLRQHIDAHAAAALALAEEAIAADEKALAVELIRWAETLRGWLEGRPRLHRGEHSPKMPSMNAEHREAISRAKTKSPMMRAARLKGFVTQKEVATAIGIKANFLSAIVKGAKKMPPDVAERLYAKTGYRWPS